MREQDGVLTGKAWMDNANPGLTAVQQVAPVSKLDFSTPATKSRGRRNDPSGMAGATACLFFWTLMGMD